MQDTGATEMQAPQDDAADDAQAQHLLAEAVQSSRDEPQDEQQDDPWADPERARREITKLRREAAKYRTQLREAEPKLTEYQKWLDSQKSEQERLAERLAQVERERDEARLGHARVMAAAAHNIPPELIGRIAGSTPEEIEEAAEELAKVLDRLVAERASTSGRSASTRPVESLRPGATPATTDQQIDMDSLLRRRAGF